MKTAVIVDNDEKHLKKCKKMLSGMEAELKLAFFQYPEYAIEFLNVEHPAVLVAELKMPIMSGGELFHIYRSQSPETVIIAMEEVEDIAATLKTLNGNGVFKLILKPFYFVEDIKNPIMTALHYYERKKRNDELWMNEMKLGPSYLEACLDNNSPACPELNDTIHGLMKGNLYFNLQLDFDEKKLLYQYINDIYKVFTRFHLFDAKLYHSYEKYLVRIFHQPDKLKYFNIKTHLQNEPEQKESTKIGFCVFLLAYLAHAFLKYYTIHVVIKKEYDFFIVRFYCEPDPVDGYQYIHPNRGLQNLLIEMCDKFLDTFAFKLVKGDERDIFSAKLYI